MPVNPACADFSTSSTILGSGLLYWAQKKQVATQFCSSPALISKPCMPCAQYRCFHISKPVKLNFPKLADVTHNHPPGNHAPGTLNKCMCLLRGISDTCTQRGNSLRHPSRRSLLRHPQTVTGLWIVKPYSCRSMTCMPDMHQHLFCQEWQHCSHICNV